MMFVGIHYKHLRIQDGRSESIYSRTMQLVYSSQVRKPVLVDLFIYSSNFSLDTRREDALRCMTHFPPFPNKKIKFLGVLK